MAGMACDWVPRDCNPTPDESWASVPVSSWEIWLHRFLLSPCVATYRGSQTHLLSWFSIAFRGFLCFSMVFNNPKDLPQVYQEGMWKKEFEDFKTFLFIYNIVLGQSSGFREDFFTYVSFVYSHFVLPPLSSLPLASSLSSTKYLFLLLLPVSVFYCPLIP